MRKTKIICTLGPAVDDEAMLRKLMKNGMNVARFNFSHGTHEEQRVRMDRVKKLRDELNLPVAILLDTKGPEIRLKNFEEGRVTVEEGQTFTLSNGDFLGNEEKVALTYTKLAEGVEVGTRILIDDGKIAMNVAAIEGDDVVCTVVNGGVVSNHKSINVPNVVIPMPYISPVDKEDILFGIEQEVDYIAASFVRTADDVVRLRNLLQANGGEKIKIISKIENVQGLHCIDEIIDASDGIMVARGDLGVEIPFKELPGIQKSMIEKCVKKGKLVVTATQMLESMTHSPRPTRAEVSDVANAIYDGTTAIMLSGESAAGDYPAEAVKTMSEIAEATEKCIDYKRLKTGYELPKDVANAVAVSACKAANTLNAKAIVAVSRSGATAEIIAHYRPECPILSAVVDSRAMRQLNLAFGVLPIQATEQHISTDLVEYAVRKAVETGYVSDGDTIVIVAGTSKQDGKPSNMMQVHVI